MTQVPLHRRVMLDQDLIAVVRLAIDLLDHLDKPILVNKIPQHPDADPNRGSIKGTVPRRNATSYSGSDGLGLRSLRGQV